jgi:hypothetical protein
MKQLTNLQQTNQILCAIFTERGFTILLLLGIEKHCHAKVMPKTQSLKHLSALRPLCTTSFVHTSW